jgi:hypothetical protein
MAEVKIVSAVQYSAADEVMVYDSKENQHYDGYLLLDGRILHKQSQGVAVNNLVCRLSFEEIESLKTNKLIVVGNFHIRSK